LIALKSVIGYYTGLDIRKLSENNVRKGYYAYLADSEDRSAEKTIRDHIFFLSAGLCKQYDFPLQVHTGMGDTPICDLRETNPLNLQTSLNDEICLNTRIVLLHTGYPFVCESGLLVNHYPNLYLDISSMVPYAGIAVETKLLELFEMAPMSKILYGSDGGGIPEHAWFAAVYFKEVLAKVLETLIHKNLISQEFAMNTASLILSENVKRVYNLK
jgi:predicted TIM-barrel fold metal-dependent hydrolase